MHKYEYTFNNLRGHVFADTMHIAQMRAAPLVGLPPFKYEMVKVRLVEKNAMVAA